jgi:hypothetical protein
MMKHYDHDLTFKNVWEYDLVSGVKAAIDIVLIDLGGHDR